MKTNKLFLLIALVLLALPVAAQDEEITLQYYGWGGEGEQEIVDICAAELGYNVEYTPIDAGVAPMMQEVRALNTAGEIPDVFMMSSGFVDEFAFDGLLLNIQEYVDRDIMPVADEYFVGSFGSGRYPNKVDSDMYAIPWRFVQTMLYYNADAFDAAGLDYPSNEWTWDDFLAAAEALTFDENADGLIDQYGYYGFGRYAHADSWVYQNGGFWLADDRQSLAPTEEALEAIEFMNALINEHGVAPQPAELEGLPNPFVSGLVAMWIDGIWNIAGFREDVEFNFGIAGVPRGPSWTQDVAYGWADMISIAAASEHPDEAWEFVSCLIGPNREVSMNIGGSIPVYRATALTDEWLQPDQQPGNLELVLDWAQFVGPTNFTPGWGEWRGYTDGAGLQGQLDEVFNGNSDIETAIANATEYANGVLNRFYGDEE